MVETARSVLVEYCMALVESGDKPPRLALRNVNTAVRDGAGKANVLQVGDAHGEKRQRTWWRETEIKVTVVTWWQ